MLAARKDRDVVSSASVDFLMFSGYVMMVYFWAQQAAVASEKLASGDGKDLLNSIKQKLKLQTSTSNVYYHVLKVMPKQWSILQKP